MLESSEPYTDSLGNQCWLVKVGGLSTIKSSAHLVEDGKATLKRLRVQRINTLYTKYCCYRGISTDSADAELIWHEAEAQYDWLEAAGLV